MIYSTPGVYIEERDNLPMSLVEVSMAIPAFIGVTQILPDGYDAEKPVPIKVHSLSDYKNLFGTSPGEKLNVAWIDDSQQPIRVNLTDEKMQRIMYYNMQLFFNNGGGDCYIVSLGTDNAANKGKYLKAIESLEKKSDITLIVLTDVAYYLNGNTDKKDVYDKAH